MEIPDEAFGYTDLLTPDGLRWHFPASALQRARGYVRSGAVRSLEVHLEGTTRLHASAEVHGTAAWPYLVDVTVDLTGPRMVVESDCDCPVGAGCKHGAATLLQLSVELEAAEMELGRVAPRVAAGSTAPRPPALGLLDAALKQLDGARIRDDRPGLALAFSWEAGDLRLPGHLRLRPLRHGARDTWVRGGVSWRELAGGARVGLYPEGQLEALEQLASTLTSSAASPYHRYYWQPPAHPRLEDFDARVWGILRRCVQTGIELLPGAGVTSIRLLEAGLRVAGDVRRHDGGLRLEIGAHHGDQWWTGDRWGLVGAAAHGAGLLAEPGTASGGSEGPGVPDEVEVRLAQLETPLSEALTHLVTAGATHVPAAEAEDFLGNQLPRLARHLPITSGDDSVVVAEPPSPVPTLAVAWGDPGGPHLAWGWAYRVGEQERTCRADSASSLNGLRDRHAERAILADLARSGLLDAGANGAGPGERLPERVRAGEVLDFAEQRLPELRRAGVEVTEEGRPDFRPAQGPVAIRFDADEGAEHDVGDDGEGDRGIDWLDLAVRIEVDGEQVPLPSLMEALTLGHPRLVLPSGLHLRTDRSEFDALREVVALAAELQDTDTPDTTQVRVRAHDLGLWARIADIAETDVLPERARDWVAKARALRDFTGLPEIEPKHVTSTLRGYQLEGFRWLAFLQQHDLGGILADDMGLGKTLQALALVAHARTEGAAPFLVVAPSSVVSNWHAEAEQHVPDLRVGVMSASQKRLGVSIADLATECDVVVTTYTLLRLEADAYADLSWGGLVCDEAQQIKNHAAKTHQAVRRVRAPFRLAVTGTPFENRLMELWALCAVVAPGLYPSAEKFTQQVVRPVEKEGDQAAMGRFRQRLSPFVLRRTKELVAADLPPRQEQVLEVELGSRHRRIYETHLARERQKILGLVSDFGRNRVAIFSALTRLRQLSLDPALVDPEAQHVGSAKTDVLVEHLRELLHEGHRALVFSQFTGYLSRVRDRLRAEGIDHAYLSGRTRKRDQAIERFTSGEADVFLISLKAGGVGLTLTEADYVFLLDPWWNPAVEAQAIDRAHRIGQTRPVMAYRLVATDTIEEKVMALKERKAELFARVMNDEGGLGGAIDVEDVRGLFR